MKKNNTEESQMSKNIFLAINGDDVGSRIGEAIANDDHKALQQASSSIQSAHDEVDQWIESIGGKKITGSGDEAIYMIPQDSMSDIDSIREHYQQKSGHGLTVGTGASMSQASKALIYGKLNGKNQVVHYEPMIEDYLSENGEEDQDQDSLSPEVPEQDDLQDQADDGTEFEQGMGELEEAPSEEEQEEGQEEQEADPSMDPQSSQDNQSKVPGAPEQESQLDSEPEAGNEDDMANDDQKTSEAPGEPVSNKTAAQKQPKKLPGEPEKSGNTGAIDGVTDEDLGTGEENVNEDPNQVPDEDEGQDVGEMEAEQVDPDAESSEEGEEVSDADIAQDPSNVNGDQVEGSDEDEEDQNEPSELSDEDVESPQEDDQEDPLASMIHGDMQGDDQEQNPSMDQEQGQDQDSSVDDELKQDIASALMAFKENKDMLEQAREQNPKLYDATLTMIRSMISMAKKLGFAPEQDMADAENNQQLQENFPEAEQEEGQEEMPEEGQEEGQEEAPEMAASPMSPKGAAPTKK